MRLVRGKVLQRRPGNVLHATVACNRLTLCQTWNILPVVSPVVQFGRNGFTLLNDINVQTT